MKRKNHNVITAMYSFKLQMFCAFFLIVFTSGCKKDFNEIASIPANESSSATLRSGPPNIILIEADDVGYEIPTYNGGRSYSTPNLDFMANNGMQFSNFFAHPDGPPSRLALVTGKYNYRNWIKFGYLPSDAKTFANMLQDAGYATCFTGKWQFNGGDASIRSHGFSNYLVFMPFDPKQNNGHDQFYRRYKNPYLYQNGQYLSDSAVNGKYSEDMMFKYASDFIDSNTTKPFFLLYANNLVQKPWTPTPDDPDYATWDPSVDDVARENKKYFPGMVAYMDKIIGKLINKIQAAGLTNNTIILFTSDNGTNKNIRSNYKGKTVRGGKGSTTTVGSRVPLTVYGPGIILPAVNDTSLTDMTDFLPTFADIAAIPKPTTWGPLDGTTFYDNMIGSPSQQRSTVYCYWPAYFKRGITISYVFNYDYKLYSAATGGYFYNVRKDPNELSPIADSLMTPFEVQTKTTFQGILNAAH